MTSSTTSPWSAAVPAGLATAVYAASEGLSVAVFDCARFRRTGRRQRAHRKLSGIPDRHFRPGAGRPRLQPGAEVRRRDADPGFDPVARLLAARRRCLRWRPNADRSLRAKSIVVASGARYRRPEIENLDAFEGRGVWYWASPIEAKLCADQDVVLVGGGNSAGQAAVFLSGHARKVYMIIRGGGLGRQHVALSDRAHRGDAEYRTDVQRRSGRPRRRRGRLAAARALAQPACAGRCADPGYPQSLPVRRRRSRHRLARRLRRQGRPRRLRADRRPVRTKWPSARCQPLETTVPGVFAVGDVRSGSVKRVGGAIGEGAQVVAALHGFLADAAKPSL